MAFEDQCIYNVTCIIKTSVRKMSRLLTVLGHNFKILAQKMSKANKLCT